MKTISLCVIARNEEHCIGRCLRSVRDYVDEMIVVDTGSEDSTPEVAGGLGAKVHRHPWIGDFSDARNQSLAHATGNWILVLDADEVLAERDARRLRELIEEDRVDGFKLIQRTYLKTANFVCASPNPGGYAEGQAYSDCINVAVIRLFRNVPGIRYFGRVHELVEPAFAAGRLPFETTGLVIHHFGKVGDPERLEHKKRLYLDLGRKKAVEEPTNALAQFEMGVQLYEMGRFPDCVKFFQASVDLDPAFDLALLYIAKALHTTGRFEEAEPYFRKCLKHSPNNDKVLFDYANFLADRGNHKAALKTYQRALAANPRHSLALFNMGVLCIQTGETERGMVLVERAIQINPNNATFHQNLGRLRLRDAQLLRAESLLQRYIERFPEAADCLGSLAEIYFKTGRFEQAAALADRALSIAPDQPRVLIVRANANFSLGRLDRAAESYRSVLLLDPTNLDSLMNLASIAEIRREHSLARSLYLRILDAHPHQPKAVRKLAAIQARTDGDAEVTDALARACNAQLHDPECFLLVGALLERSGELDRATELYREAARQKPDWTEMIHRRIERLKVSVE